MSRWWGSLRRHVGAAGRGVTRALSRSDRAGDPGHAGDPGPETTASWDQFDQALVDLARAGERDPVDATELLTRLRELPPGPPPRDRARNESGAASAERWVALRTVARRLVRQNQHAEAQDLLRPVLDSWAPDPRSGLPALAAHADLALTGRPPHDLATAAAAALAGADEALAQDDPEQAADLIVIGAGLLLHRDLHADVPRSALVDDPVELLAPFRESAAMAALAAPLAAPPPPSTAPAPARRGSGRRTRVVVLPGAYPRFATPLVAALRARSDVRVRVLPLIKRHRAFRWLGTDPELVRLRLAATRGQDPREDPGSFAVDEELLDHLRTADVVVADWGDKGAVWASLVAPPTARLVIRVHGMDTFGLWLHAVDWSRVDALVTVSPHQAEVVDDVLRHGAVGAAIAAPPRCQVVPNLVSLPPVLDPPVRAPQTLALVGWAKRVKDPLWAVEVLAGLRARGGDWRLRLIGDDFQPGGVATSQEYADQFAERIARPDVVDHVDLVPQTDDVAREVAGVGFVLSASIRESFHLGLVEGVLGGAVPVVRDWPFFAARHGAARLFPPDWVVPDVDAAVDRIWTLRDAADRDDAAAASHAEARARFDPEHTTDALLRLVLGDEPAG